VSSGGFRIIISGRSTVQYNWVFIRSPLIMTGARGTTTPTGANRLVSKQNILQNNSCSLSYLDQAVAPRAGLRPEEERVRPGESTLARCAMTCSDGGRFSGEPTSAGVASSAGCGDAGRCRAWDTGSVLGALRRRA
jgi:hypothetical protein